MERLNGTVKIDCDEGMIVALLRNWHPNRLQPQGVRLSILRPKLINDQRGICPLCQKTLCDNGKDTHIDHIVTVKDILNKIRGGMTFDDAYRRLWANANVRAICSRCNYDRRKDDVISEAVPTGD